ncbi:MAG: hypothetical protein ABI877_04065 [Gemmatimonadaceae bacterium]
MTIFHEKIIRPSDIFRNALIVDALQPGQSSMHERRAPRWLTSNVRSKGVSVNYNERIRSGGRQAAEGGPKESDWRNVAGGIVLCRSEQGVAEEDNEAPSSPVLQKEIKTDAVRRGDPCDSFAVRPKNLLAVLPLKNRSPMPGRKRG